MTCAEFLAVAESYAGVELPGDAPDAVMRHLDRCAGCRRELDARIALRQTLRRAFMTAPSLAPDARFVTHVHAAVRTQAFSDRSRFTVSSTAWLAIAAGLLLAVVAGTQFRSFDLSTEAPPHLRALVVHAARDHHDCALTHTLPEAPIPLEEAARRHNAAYAALRRNIDRSEPVRSGDIDVVGAHWCVLDGRPFVHVVVRHSGHVVSLLLTPVDRAAGAQQDAAACPSAEGFNVACFDARGHAGFVVSDLSERENLELARALAPVLRASVAGA
jgi:anti-sigma factor RsiW